MTAVGNESTSVTGDEGRPGGTGTRRVRNVLLIVLALVLVAVGVIFGPTMLRVIQQRHTSVAAPDEVAGLTQDKAESATTTAEYIRDAVATAVDLDKSVGVVYKDSAGNAKSVMFVGGTARIWRPGATLTDVFKVITDDTGGVSGVRDVPAGSLGGVMRCGTTKTDDGEMSVCGWADNGSLAVALFLARSIDDSAQLFQQMRSAMQHR
jgi:hypothetical protein